MSSNNGTQTLESMSQAVWYNRWTVSKFRAFLKGKILEVGCGIGNFTEILTDYGEVFAVDIDKNNLYVCKKSAKGAKVGFGDIEKGSVFFDDQLFDTIVCLNVLEHIKDDAAALENMYNLLKKGGVLILLVPANKSLFGQIDKSIGHFRRYDKKELVNFLENKGFKVIRKRVINLLGALGWFFSAKVFKNDGVGKGQVKVFDFIAPFVLPLEDIIEPPIGTSILVIAKK